MDKQERPAEASPEIIRTSQLKSETGLSPSTCRRLSLDPTSGFPKKIKLTPNGTAVGYLKSELKEWRESRPKVIC
jgi:predicted DNA-binding transcriptional regulator AlpA